MASVTLINNEIFDKQNELIMTHEKIENIRDLVIGSDEYCDNFDSCGTCTMNEKCIWCYGNNKCVPGNSSGPVEGKCAQFDFLECTISGC